MKRQTIISLAVALMAGTAQAQLNSPGADGYLARGIEMYNDHNYNGCIDQLAQLRNFTIAPEQREDAAYFLALATLHSGDDEAIDLIKHFLATYPQSPRYQEMVMNAGDYYFTQGAYEEALRWYKDVNPQALIAERAAELTYRQAYSDMMLHRYAEARPLFSRLIGNPEYANAAYFYLAYMDYDDGAYADALALFKKVNTNVEPGTAAPYYMSQIYFLDGDYSRAIDMALKTIESNAVAEFAPEANRIAGESYYNMGHTERALPYLWRYASLAEDPQPSTLFILGVSEYNSGNVDNAIPLFQKATKAEGKTAQAAWLYLGQSYLRKDNPDGALLAFEKAYKADADPAVTETAFYNYIVARTAGGRMPFANTVGMFEEFLSRYPQSRYATTIQESLISGYMNDGDYQSALEALDKIKNLTPALRESRQRVLFELGTREYLAGKHADAAGLLTQATSGPSAAVSRQATLWLADCNYERGRLDEAARGYLSYTDQDDTTDPNYALAYYNLGYTRYKQQRYGDAVIDFERVIAANPGPEMSADAYNRIADCYYQQHQFANAEAAYAEAQKRYPAAGDYALYQLSVMQGLQNKRQEQLASIDRLTSEYPTSTLVPAAIFDRAEAYAVMGLNDKAMDTYRRIIREYGSNTYGRQAYLQLAIAQYNAGQRQGAIDSYKQIVLSYPTSAEAKLAVDDLKRIYAADGKLEELNAFLISVPNSPRLTSSELDELAFHTAEEAYLNTGKTTGLRTYLDEHPHGAYEAQTYYYLAEAAYEEGNLDQALEYATEVVLNHPDSDMAFDAMLLKADTEARQGKSEIALDTYRTLEKKAAGSRIVGEARLGIMRTALNLKRYSEVLVTTDKLKASSNVDPEMPEIEFSEALALAGLNRHDEAYTIWRRLATDPNNLFGARSAVSLAQSLFDRNKTDEASKTINAFINANSPHQYWQARAFILLSDILRRQGNTFEADEYLKALRSNYPGKEADIFNMIDKRLK